MSIASVFLSWVGLAQKEEPAPIQQSPEQQVAERYLQKEGIQKVKAELDSIKELYLDTTLNVKGNLEAAEAAADLLDKNIGIFISQLTELRKFKQRTKGKQVMMAGRPEENLIEAAASKIGEMNAVSLGLITSTQKIINFINEAISRAGNALIMVSTMDRRDLTLRILQLQRMLEAERDFLDTLKKQLGSINFYFILLNNRAPNYRNKLRDYCSKEETFNTFNALRQYLNSIMISKDSKTQVKLEQAITRASRIVTTMQ